MARHESGEVDSRRRMHRALRESVARLGGVRRVSGLSLIAVLCASVVAPAALVGQSIGPALAAWLAAAGSVGSNLVADVITRVVADREVAGDSAEHGMQEAVAAELEAQMAGTGPEAAALRGAVAALLREHGAQQMLVEVLAEGDGGLRVALAESIALLAGRFEEFTGLLSAIREGIKSLQQPAAVQQAENLAQAQHRGLVNEALGRILQLLQDAPAPTSEAGAVFHTLPPDTTAFTGRRDELDEIIGHVTAAVARGGAVSIHAIDGMPGVGKSTLAVHVAHTLADQFPDRQLFVDLHAHTIGRQPADPAAALAGLLTGDGLDPRQLPTGLEELSALWRNRMAGRRALLVLDNAADSTQVTPLLPGGAGTLVLVTSRRHLGDLPFAITKVSLDVLPPKDAVAMFLRLAPRAAGDEEKVADLVALAGHLPLAISLLARVYAKHSTWTMSELIEETHARLLTLSAERDTVAAAFDLSYQVLPAARQRFFRLLGLHPGSDLDPYAAAALAGTSPTQAGQHLNALFGDHLVTEPGYRRYSMHDLVRSHARALAMELEPASEQQAAIHRLLHYYAHTAKVASLHIARLPRSRPDGPTLSEMPALPDPETARAWLRAEYSNLDTAFTYANTQALDEHTTALAVGLAEILQADGPWAHAIEVHRAAADAAERWAEPTALASALTDLGRARFIARELPETAEALARALKIYRRIGDRLGEANALNDLGRVRAVTGDLPGAADAQAQAQAIYRRLGNHRGEANALALLVQVRYMTEDFLGAAHAVAHALEVYRQIGDHLGEAEILIYQGMVRRTVGDIHGAIDAAEQALQLYRDLGNRHGQANALGYLGLARHAAGDLPGAADALIQALDFARQSGTRQNEAIALTTLGQVRCATGDLPGALKTHTQALEIYHQTGDRVNKAWALNHYAAAIAATGDRPRALALYQQALSMNRELHKPDDEAISLEGIADHHFATGDLSQCTEHLHQALAIYRRVGMLADAARVEARMVDLASQSQ